MNTMTYRELQEQLKIWKEQGLTTIALNSSKWMLMCEVSRIMKQYFAIPEEEVIAKMEAEKKAEKEAEHGQVDANYSDPTTIKYQEYSQCSDHHKKRLLDALNYRFIAYGYYYLATEIIDVEYDCDNKIWRISYANGKSGVMEEYLYDSELATHLAQLPEVFDPKEAIEEVVTTLHQEIPIKVKKQENRYILYLDGVSMTFLIREKELIFCDRLWSSPSIIDYVDKKYRSYSEIPNLIGQLRSDFWFYLEVVGVA